MNDRPNDLRKIRPEIPSARVNEQMSENEIFQNRTIRPIVKLQSPLLIEVFRNYIAERKNVFYDLSLEKKQFYIQDTIYKDVKFRKAIEGMIIGQFTVKEYLIYTKNSSALNKRIINIVRERLLSNIQLFDRSLLDQAI